MDGDPLTFPAGSRSLPGGATPIPLPSADVPVGFVWPGGRGRATLRAATGHPIHLRSDLIGRHGTADGSGRTDTLVCRTGAFCIKTSARRRYSDADAGCTALVRAAREKTMLGELCALDTALVLQPDGLGAFWLWTVSPWLTTLRSRMSDANEAGDEHALGAALADFARAASSAMALASTRRIVLDVHPSNFAMESGRDGDRLRYLDDDVSFAESFPMLGHALLRRVEEYEERPGAIDRYLGALEAEIAGGLDAVARAGLRAAVEQCFVRSPAALEAQARIVSHLRWVARRASPRARAR